MLKILNSLIQLKMMHKNTQKLIEKKLLILLLNKIQNKIQINRINIILLVLINKDNRLINLIYNKLKIFITISIYYQKNQYIQIIKKLKKIF